MEPFDIAKLTAKIFAALFAFLVAFLLILSFWVNQNIIKSNLEIALNNKIEGKFIIGGDVKAVFIPSPKITINNPEIKNFPYNGHMINIEMESAVIKTGFFSLFSSNPKISQLKLNKPIFDYAIASDEKKKELISDAKKIEEEIAKEKKEEKEAIEDKELAEKIEAPSILDDDFGAKSMVEKDLDNLEASEKSPLDEIYTSDENNYKSPLDEDEDDKIDPNLALLEEKLLSQKTKNNISYDNASLTSKIIQFQGNNNEIFSPNRIESIEVVNGSFKQTGLGGEVILDVKNINFISESDIEDSVLNIFGALLFNEVPTQFELLLNTNNSYSKLFINSTIFNMELDGEFIDSDIKNLAKSSFSGMVKAQIFNPKEFINKYFSKYSLIYGRVAITDQLNLEARIKSSKGNHSISNIKLSSDFLSGVGEFNINLAAPKPFVKSSFNIAKADLNGLWTSHFTNQSEQIINFEKSLVDKFINFSEENDNKTFIISQDDIKKAPIKSIFDNLDMDMKIKINKAKYFAHNISKVEIDLDVSDEGNLKIKQASMVIPDGGSMTARGEFRKDNNIPSFVGSYEIEGNDLAKFATWIELSSKYLKIEKEINYDISGKIMVLSNFSALKDLKISIDNDKNLINGSIKYDHSQDIQNIDYNFAVDQLNVKDYFNISLERNIYLTPGYLSKKFLWLNTIPVAHNVSINFDKLTYNNHNFYNQDFSFTLKPRFVSLNNLSFKSDDKKVDFKLSSSINLSLKPKLFLNLELNNYKYKAGELEDNGKYKRLYFADRFFFLPTLSDFDGEIIVKSKNSSIENTKIANAYISGNLKEGILKIENGLINIHGGDLKYNGEVVLRKIKSINGQFIATNVEAKEFLSNIVKLDNISGKANMSGIFSAYGKDFKEFLSALDVKLQFIGANIKVGKFGLEELLKQMLQLSYSKKEIDKAEDILFNDKYSTLFSKVKGTFELNKNKNELKISASSLGINAVSSGKIDLPRNALNNTAKLIFLTGTRKKQVPINIIVTNKGAFTKLQNLANVSQVDQYVKQIGARVKGNIKVTVDNKIEQPSQIQEQNQTQNQEVDSQNQTQNNAKNGDNSPKIDENQTKNQQIEQKAANDNQKIDENPQNSQQIQQNP